MLALWHIKPCLDR